MKKQIPTDIYDILATTQKKKKKKDGNRNY